jgi:hypothetical protein
LRNDIKLGKYSLAKFDNFVYMFVLRAEIVTIFCSKMVTISARNTNDIMTYTKYANFARGREKTLKLNRGNGN